MLTRMRERAEFTGRRISMDDAHVQDYVYLKPYKELIRNEWIEVPDYSGTDKTPGVVAKFGGPQPGDMVVHFRPGDPRKCTPGKIEPATRLQGLQRFCCRVETAQTNHAVVFFRKCSCQIIRKRATCFSQHQDAPSLRLEVMGARAQ